MKKKVLRLFALSAIVGLGLVPEASSQAICPTALCSDLVAHCVAEGNNQYYMGYVEPLGPCVTSPGGAPATKSYIRCCRLPGCSEDIWIKFCTE